MRTRDVVARHLSQCRLAGCGRGNGNGVRASSWGADAESGSAWRRAKRPGDQGLKGYIFVAGVLIYSVFRHRICRATA